MVDGECGWLCYISILLFATCGLFVACVLLHPVTVGYLGGLGPAMIHFVERLSKEKKAAKKEQADTDTAMA